LILINAGADPVCKHFCADNNNSRKGSGVQTMAIVIRVAWMAVFLLGAAALAWLEWRSAEPSAMAWFLLSGLWSAVCGIGYTVMHWFKLERAPRRIGTS
jgi:hypothetical protein